MNFNVTGAWTAMSALTSIPIGTLVSLRNIGRSGDVIEVIVSDTEPLVTDRGEAVVQFERAYSISADSEVWLRYISYIDQSITVSSAKTCLVTITENTYLNESGGIPADIFTNDTTGVRRLSVDSQQTSYEENTQFRFFDTFDGISNNNQIVYKFVTGNPVNVLQRYLELYSGGRQLLVYRDTENVTFTGTLVDSGGIFPVNSVLNSSIATHPVTGLTAQRAVGSGIFSTSDAPIDGSSVVSDSQGSSSSSAFSADGLRTGVPAGVTSYFVLDAIANNDAASGSIRLVYEERF